IMADRELLSRVLDNLIDNAIRYTQPGGHIDITVDANDQTLTIGVGDDGEGIPLDEQTRIFDKFAQGSTSYTRLAHQGAGLGLAFCRLAVEAHGGTITASGKPGQGAMFTITLPIAP
ncbi:MAG TPA: ATP-binding protein, partial [Anaerolineae bacterium]